MRPPVRDAFHSFTAPFEGKDVPWMYLDVIGLVTTGNGNLIDPVAMAVGLPWRKPDGSLASREEIISEWHAVKQRKDLMLRGGMVFRNVTKLRLDKQAMHDLLFRKLDQNEAILRKRFPEWDSWPADAQLGVHSMAWAMGPRFGFPKFSAACLRGDFAAAADECRISTIPDRNGRNQANRQLFLNAAFVRDTGADPAVLIYGSDPEEAA